MLDKTQDPIADFINAICADVVSYVAKLKFSEFIADSRIRLKDLNTYEGTLQRASRNGFKIENVIYNGYISSPELQSIQDSSIQSRTQIRLNAEIEKQKNILINLKIESEKKRRNLQTDLKKLKKRKTFRKKKKKICPKKFNIFSPDKMFYPQKCNKFSINLIKN